jgi:hypothetical protein
VQWLTEHITESLLAAVVMLMGFLGKRAIERIDEIDARKANKDDLTALLRQLESRIEDDRELRRQVSSKFDEFGDALSQVRVSVATIAGRLERP